MPRLPRFRLRNMWPMPGFFIGADVAHVVAFVRFDLDHVGAQLGEDLGRERTHHDGGEIENFHPGQRTWHFFTCAYSGGIPAARTSLPQ